MLETLKNIKNRDIGPKLYDRKEKKFVHERIPLKEWMYIQLLYSKPAAAKVDKHAAVRSALRTETIEAGRLNDTKISAKRIPKFIKFFEIDMSQFEKENPSDYETFNDFFIREVKSDKRPVSNPEDNSILVSGADSRLTVFNSLEETKDLWIKGTKFSFEKLLNNDKILTECFRNGSVANLRLAPQDYHRFHSPVDGHIEKIVKIGGTDYETQPKVIKSEIDVFDDNERSIFVIEGVEGVGKVAFVAIGAERVGLVTPVVKEGEKVKKGQELGFFSYGGSDVLVLFEKKIIWDEDLREHSLKGIETLVQTNERIGKFQELNENQHDSA